LHLPGSSPEKKTAAARRRRSPATISGELGSGETADGERRATVITVAAFGGSPASRFSGNRRMEAATVCRLRRAIPLYCGSARGKEKVRGAVDQGEEGGEKVTSVGSFGALASGCL
jgi:hypothetical protein